MSRVEITDEAVEAATRALHPGLFEDDGLLHPALALSGQWQARHKVRAALEAALPHLAPRPVVDREALAKAAHKHFCVVPAGEPNHEPDEIDFDKADEILEILALPNGTES